MNPFPGPPPASRILVIRLGAVGDVVRTLPAVSALRAGYPGARIAWLVEPASAGIVQGQPWVDEVIVFPRGEIRARAKRGDVWGVVRLLGGVVRELRARRFELVVDFHSILKSGVLSYLTRAPLRVTYARPFAREFAHRFANSHARLEPAKLSRFDRNLGLVRYLGVAAPPAEAPLALAPERVANAQAELRKLLGSDAAPVAMHPGTSDATSYKRYRVEHYAWVARELAARGTPVIVTCGPARDDRAFADAIVDAAAGAARIAPATPSLADLAALFSHCRLYIGSDTGPMHVASLVGTPVIQLMGPTDPVENEPYRATPSKTLRVQIACNPCRRGCAAATCMGVISPQSVLEAAQGLLAKPPAEVIDCAAPNAG